MTTKPRCWRCDRILMEIEIMASGSLVCVTVVCSRCSARNAVKVGLDTGLEEGAQSGVTPTTTTI